MKKIVQSLIGGVAVLALLVPAVAGAAEFVKPSDESGNVLLSTTETHRNVYAVGGGVTVNSATMGDLVVAGGTITVDGPVESDIIVAGGTVIINNKVGGDIRAAGGTVNINAAVAGDVLVGGGTVLLSERATVGGDVVVGGGSSTIAAPVAGKVWAAGGSVTINSAIGGSVTVRGADSVTFGPQANIPGTIVVRANNEPEVKDGARVSSIDYARSSHPFSRGDAARAIIVASLIAFIAYIITALVFAWTAPRKIATFAAQVKNRFWINVGLGVAALVLLPIATVVLFAIFIGYQLALILLAGYLCALAVAWVLSVLWTGAWVLQLAKKLPHLAINWQTALVGALIFTLLRFVPVVGSLFCFIVVMACFGQLLTNAKRAVVEGKEQQN